MQISQPHGRTGWAASSHRPVWRNPQRNEGTAGPRHPTAPYGGTPRGMRERLGRVIPPPRMAEPQRNERAAGPRHPTAPHGGTPRGMRGQVPVMIRRRAKQSPAGSPVPAGQNNDNAQPFSSHCKILGRPALHREGGDGVEGRRRQMARAKFEIALCADHCSVIAGQLERRHTEPQTPARGLLN